MRIINFRLIALSIFIHLSLARALRFRFTRCLFFSRYATARRRILSFIPFSPLALSLIVRCFAPSPPGRPVTRACVFCVWRARACMSVCCSRDRLLSTAFEAQLPHAALSYRWYRDGCVYRCRLFMSGGSYTRKSARFANARCGHDETVVIIGFPCDSQCNRG